MENAANVTVEQWAPDPDKMLDLLAMLLIEDIDGEDHAE